MFARPVADKLPVIAFALTFSCLETMTFEPLGLNALLWVAMFWRRA